jgi:hypothetical protein
LSPIWNIKSKPPFWQKEKWQFQFYNEECHSNWEWFPKGTMGMMAHPTFYPPAQKTTVLAVDECEVDNPPKPCT